MILYIEDIDLIKINTYFVWCNYLHLKRCDFGVVYEVSKNFQNGHHY